LDYRDPDLFQEDSDSGSGSARGTYDFEIILSVCTRNPGQQGFGSVIKRIRTLDPDLWRVPTFSKFFKASCVPRDRDPRRPGSVSIGFGLRIRTRDGTTLNFLTVYLGTPESGPGMGTDSYFDGWIHAGKVVFTL